VTEQLQQEYALRFQAMADYRHRVWTVLTRDFFSRWVRPEHTVLDLGCGWGEFINQIPAAKKYGMDLNPDSATKLSPDITCLRQDCSTEWAVPESSLDVVFTSNFFEHLPDKPALTRTLAQAFRCLKPGGRLIALGPNIKYLPGAYWDFWDHYLPLTELALEEGGKLAGFTPEQVTARFLPYSMSQGFRPPIVLMSWYLRLPFLWRWFGKQFLLVLRKPL
jgi:SAM-dependent methyltransferase